MAVYCSNECAAYDWDAIHSRQHYLQEEKLVRVLKGRGKQEGNVYLGSVAAIRDRKILFKHRIDFVISVLDNRRNKETGGLEFPLKWNEEAVGGKDKLLRITMWDDEDEDISQYFDLVADTIQKHVSQGHNVLIHCVAGHSRSVTLLIYYMLKYRAYKSVDTALDYIQKRRPFAHPNEGFLYQLYEAEESFFES